MKSKKSYFIIFTVVSALLLFILTGCNQTKTETASSQPTITAQSDNNDTNKKPTDSVQDKEQSNNQQNKTTPTVKPETNNKSNQSQDITFTSKNFGFSLKIPKSWEGKYDVVENDRNVTFYHVFKGQKLTQQPLLMIIAYNNEAEYNEAVKTSKELHGVIEIGKIKDKYYYVPIRSSCIGYEDSQTDALKEFEKMEEEAKEFVKKMY